MKRKKVKELMIINRSVNHWLVLFMLVMSPAALAVGDKMNSVDVTFAGWTEHLTSSDRNQDNTITGLRYKQVEAFTLVNSFEHRAYGADWYPQWRFNQYMNYGVRIGGLTGYTKEENSLQVGGVTPFIAPAISFHYDHLGAEVALFTDVVVMSLKVVI
ncbi:hypothetical protein ACWX0P_00190 [Vibrio mediterranei]